MLSNPRRRRPFSTRPLHPPRRFRFGVRARRATLQWITIRSKAIVNNIKTPDHRSFRAAWRLAAESCLINQNLISVSTNRNVLPHSSLIHAS